MAHSVPRTANRRITRKICEAFSGCVDENCQNCSNNKTISAITRDTEHWIASVDEEFEKLSINIDSGAIDHVMNRRHAAGFAIKPSPMSKNKRHYSAANGTRISNEGQREIKGLKPLTPSQYIHKQATLESNHPGTSALTQAMHKEFIKQLQQNAFVKAFGFQELLASDDAFSLMGLQGEDKYAFRDFPRENKLSATKEQEQKIEANIMQALKKYGFYDRIMKSQMFE